MKVWVAGDAAAKVSPSVTFEDGNRTAVLDVTADFAAGDRVLVSGLAFGSFSGSSPFDSLELEVANDGVAALEDLVGETRHQLRDAVATAEVEGASGKIHFDAHGDRRQGVALSAVERGPGGRPIALVRGWLGES
mgnify:CR=1 FL=1